MRAAGAVGDRRKKKAASELTDLGPDEEPPESTDHSPRSATAPPRPAVSLDELPRGWQAATRYHRLRRSLPDHLRREVEQRAVDEIMQRARTLLRHAARPTRTVASSFPEEGELDLEATLENPRPWGPDALVLRRTETRDADIVVILDMSLSMTGEKVALIALAAAILKLRLEHVAVVQFDTDARALVRMDEPVPVRELVRRILTVPAQGYTNIEAGLRVGLDALSRGRRREKVGVIMTDGIANTGGNPVELAGAYPRLHVVQIGTMERQGSRTCTELARAGRGRRYCAIIYSQLPSVVRQLVRDCFRA